MLTIQELIAKLSLFWADHGCVIHQGHDVETGAGTFNPATFFRCLGPEPYRAAYTEVSRRPSDGRYGKNPNRTQQFHQFQVIIKPAPFDIQKKYLESLEAIGFNLPDHDIRFVHDDWEQPSLGAHGLGWEVWRDGMEITQFTYFQGLAGQELDPITVELTYGLERLALPVQGVDSFWDLKWNDTLSYHDIYHAAEVEWSRYNFEYADTEMWHRHFNAYEAEAMRLADVDLAIPGYDFVMKASHAFNLLDARGVISVQERAGYIGRLRNLAKKIATSYLKGREQLGTPLLTREWPGHKRPPMTPAPLLTAFSADTKEDFLLEIGSEELPATFVPIGARNLERSLEKLLHEHGLSFDKIDIYATPRRLSAYVIGLIKGLPATTTERRGPKVDNEKACEGFFRSTGLSKGDATIRDGYYYAQIEKPARSSAEILSKHLPKLITSLDFPKTMRWGIPGVTYARPLHWITALHGKDIVPIEVGDIHSGRTSHGHSQLKPTPFEIDQASDYVERLRTHQVIVDIEERKTAILDQLEQIQKETGLEALQVQALLPHVVHMVEWPQLTTSTFDKGFLETPAPVLMSEMVHHQKDFPLADKTGKLANQFVITADNNPSDEIRRGNTKVLSARLSDGQFLYQKDLKTPIAHFNEKLATITYREGLGSMHDKTKRIEAIVEILHKALPIGDLETAKRAALLSKADLSSELVGEFPDLQGVIGKIYALEHGEGPDVATAINEHWMPRGDGCPLPATPAGTLVAIADKLDNLISHFALNLRPTSSSDPYGLRRQVLGITRILVDGKHHLSLGEALKSAYDHFIKTTGQSHDPELIPAIKAFFLNRIKTVFQDYGLKKDEIEASLASGFTDIYDSFLRAKALHTFRSSDVRFLQLAEVYKRAKGILPEESHVFSEEKLIEPAEKALATALFSLEAPFYAALQAHDYDKAYGLLAKLQPPLATLFDEVKVMTDDKLLRINRLSLLQRVFGLFAQILDFSKIQITN